MKDNLIPNEQLHKLPFLYKFLKKTKNTDSDNSVKEMPYIAGNIASIQNDNAKLETFYKCISRF